MSEIDQYFKAFWEGQLHYIKDEVLHALSWADFAKAVSTMNPRSRGVKIEARILRLNGWDKIRGHANYGDGQSEGKTIEVKSSVITPLDGSQVTFRGLKTWIEAKVDMYVFVLIELKDFRVGLETTTFKLNRDQILYERDERGTLRPFGGKKADRGEKVELGSSFKKGDLVRWKKAYACTDLILENLPALKRTA